jgi:hypothetical protein
MKSHLWEIHDQHWCPPLIRNEVTLTLRNLWCMPVARWIEDWIGFRAPYKVVGDALINSLWDMEGHRHGYTVVDICSGSGGPIPKVTKYLNKSYRTRCNYILTDLYPNIGQFKAIRSDLISFESKPVDACQLPAHLSSFFRTSFGSFHHLPPNVAHGIFEDIIENRGGIGIFEMTGPNIFSIVTAAIGVPIVGFFLMLTSRPSFTRLFLWLSGIIPLILLIDGTLSNLRSYEKQDLLEMIESIPGNESVKWKYETIPCFDMKSSALGEFRIFKWISPLIEQMLLLRILTGVPIKNEG